MRPDTFSNEACAGRASVRPHHSRRTAQQVGLAVGVAAVVFVGAARASGLLADVVASAPAAVSGYALTFTVTAVVLLGTEVLVRADALGRGAQDTFGAGA